jgi:hypothetical protein
MKPQITAFLKSCVPSLPWEINPQKSPIENLAELLSQLQELKTLVDTAQTNPQNPEEALKKQRRLLRSLKEAGLTLASLDLLQLVLKKKKFSSTNKELQKMGLPHLSSNLLSLYAKSRFIRTQAQNFPGAELEIEADHAALLSLYQIAVHQKTNK